MLTLDSVKAFLRVDFDDDNALILTLMDTAREYLRGAVGDLCGCDSSRADLIQLMVIQDLYDNHALTEKTDSRLRQLIHDFNLQLRLENRGNADAGL